MAFSTCFTSLIVFLNIELRLKRVMRHHAFRRQQQPDSCQRIAKSVIQG